MKLIWAKIIRTLWGYFQILTKVYLKGFILQSEIGQQTLGQASMHFRGILQPSFSKIWTKWNLNIWIQMHWECLAFLDIPIYNTGPLPWAEAWYWHTYLIKQINLFCHRKFRFYFRRIITYTSCPAHCF